MYSFQVFMANEKLDNKVMQHLIFMQVCSSNTTEHIHILCLLFPHTTPPNSPYISSHTSCYLHWEKQVVDQTFHKNLISSYIPLTLAHTLPVIFIGRNKLLIKTHENLISSYIPLTSAHTLPVIFTGRNKLLIKTFM